MCEICQREGIVENRTSARAYYFAKSVNGNGTAERAYYFAKSVNENGTAERAYYFANLYGGSEMYRTILSFVLMLFWLTPLCHTEEIPIDTIIRGVNKARLTIRSGEVYSRTVIEASARKTEEEIAEWIQTEKELKLRGFTPNSSFPNVEQYEKEYLIPYLNFEAKRYRAHTEREHTTTLFQMLEPAAATRPKTYSYKLTMVESPGRPIDNISNQFRASDELWLLVYDMQTQVKEYMGGIISPTQHSTFFDPGGQHYGYRHFTSWGRSPVHVPSDAELIGKETIDDVECYDLIFIARSEGKVPRKVRIFVEPAKDFSVRRIEYYPVPAPKRLVTRIDFKKFKKFGDIWFPQILVDTVYFRDGSQRKRATTEVITAEFNVDFPKDFFKLDLSYY